MCVYLLLDNQWCVFKTKEQYVRHSMASLLVRTSNNKRSSTSTTDYHI